MQLAAPTLLITDDDCDFRTALREVFEPRGYQTFQAGDGEEALQILTRERIDVAVFDMHMPRLDGLQAARRAREIRIFIPFILLTAALDEKLVLAARQLDLFAALAKPVSCRDITRTVQAAIQSRAS